MIAHAVNAVVQVVSVIVLARLLSPEDYGLAAMIATVVGIAMAIVDMGTQDAVTQQARITPAEMSTLFWVTVALGCGLALIIAISGPLFAYFYHEPRVKLIAFVYSFAVIVAALLSQHQALMRRAMMFQKLAFISTSANVLSAIAAIAVASLGYGYWALVVRQLATYSVTLVGVWICCRWLPGKPALTAGAKQMLKFGMHFVGFTAADAVGRFSDRIAIGHTYGAWNLGFYQKAVLVYDNLLSFMPALHQVAMTGLSQLRGDVEKLRRSWSMALGTIAFYAMPGFGVLAVVGHDVVILLLGAKWSNAGMLLSILALRGIPHVVERTMVWLHVAAGRADRCMRWGVIAAIAQIAALFCGLPFGVKGVVIAYVVCSFVLFLPATAYSGRPWGIGIADVWNVVRRPMAGALLAMAVALGIRSSFVMEASLLMRIVLFAAIYFSCYAVLVIGVLGMREPLRVVGTLVRDFRTKSRQAT